MLGPRMNALDIGEETPIPAMPLPPPLPLRVLPAYRCLDDATVCSLSLSYMACKEM
jgi:hypothetical protein